MARGPFFIELMAQYVPGTRTQYSMPATDGTTTTHRFNLPRSQAGVSVRYLVETTRTAHESFIHDVDRQKRLRGKGAWNTYYAGVGFSSAFFTRWFVRTSLRYTPRLTMTVAGRGVPAADFEFDFFQFVLYPARLRQ
jgi:hypothetical protein